MAATLFQQRTSEILAQYRRGCDEIMGDHDGHLEPEAFARYDGLARDTVRLLREAKTECVREEARSADEILGEGRRDEHVDLGYSSVKLEIDLAIDEVLSDKMRFRAPRSAPAPNEVTAGSAGLDVGEDAEEHANAVGDQPLLERLEKLVELQEFGVLTGAEFESLKASLLEEDE